MDTIHDLGGRQGFGPILHQFDDDDVMFPEEWKARLWAIAMMSMSKLSQEETGWTLDWYRHVLERLPPDLYLRFDYFEKWTLAMMVTAIDEGIADVQEFVDGHAGSAQMQLQHMPPQTESAATFDSFKPGDRVVAKRDSGSMHTRLPSYVRGRRGIVEGVTGPQPLPDRSATGRISIEQTYAVRFDMKELWPEAALSRDVLLIDMWESYLDPV
ncbi:nitrile hydratase subunit beta [Rhizobium ruizarguesonis]|uniref:SH3-like domain-containing protein n=1 Tax=Rhizobium ruizarguesonis TaxID=2081791 RepID=UPI0004199747|nr:SH3-like domain-containing protein [Rhizobium ruizarguesonis]MBY5832099.1 nitrile hydratase subunit beta [Rhizobium leguminosarum]QJS26527.1 nitrile hydratase subunit beta [Rhizobium leguminosarum bv. trifolii TA1]MBY5860792.1 nitrile hydratase subunit beta [Rhizobium leguminosarum]MBY5875432.1 nitrile hydratase subunit beta [Rhizobium leguminosarum]NEH66909.1 nitrile hydratase subunit beta [Rhizobium ruizarguesonis]